jgi:hypothetical protein
VNALIWLKAQGSALLATAGAVAANHPEPARQVLIYTAALALIIWAAFKIANLVSK